ncbi:STAS domain-containing protein [Streptomyces albofaciens]|uniref:STAS domain-containing protein n=1 Tax=Streptomyces albofaciens TaxID=66866 RepID=UPI00142E97EA|nr:STAS domain-containing protein [Streptomyces albofaciens]
MTGLCSRYFRGRGTSARRLTLSGRRWWRQDRGQLGWITGPYRRGDGPCWRARRDGETLLLWVRGDLDLELAQRLAPALPQVSSPAVRTVVLDLSEVTFFDCSGLQWLCEVRSRVAAHGGETYLRQPPRCVYRVLQLVPLARPFALLPAPGPGAARLAAGGRSSRNGARRLGTRRNAVFGATRPHGG